MTILIDQLKYVPMPVWLRITLGLLGLLFFIAGVVLIWDTWTDSFVQVKTSRHDAARSYPTHAKGMLPIKMLLSLQLSGIVFLGFGLILCTCRRVTFAFAAIAGSLSVFGALLFCFTNLILGLGKVFFLG
jgi:hypothetical protein